MTRQRITPVAVLLAAVLAMGAAKAQETVMLAIPVQFGVRSGAGATKVIVTAKTGEDLTFVSDCMRKRGFDSTHTEKVMVGINSNDSPHAVIILGGVVSPDYGAGTQIVNLLENTSCLDAGNREYVLYQGTVVRPKNRNVALVTAPAGVTLAADHEAVVGAGTDETGIADAVCVKKGEKSIKTEIISDIPLESGDRLTDFLELDFNPDTGETLYGAWLEY